MGFTISEMMEMQEKLQEKYRNIWDELSPEKGRDKLLWTIGEIGEVIDIVKKNGEEKLMQSAALKEELVTELADVLMYFNEILMCYGISEDELKQAYTDKFKKNMQRW